MISKPQDISTYSFNSSDHLLLDTNVWLFVHGPSAPGDKRVRIYSNAIDKMLRAQSTVYIDVLIISEFINRYARLRHNIRRTSDKATPTDFKKYRKGAYFKQDAQEIGDAVRRVLKNCTRTDSGLASTDIELLIEEYERGESDFNDQILIELCKRHGWTLVTDDGDFKKKDVSVVTANLNLLT